MSAKLFTGKNYFAVADYDRDIRLACFYKERVKFIDFLMLLQYTCPNLGYPPINNKRTFTIQTPCERPVESAIESQLNLTKYCKVAKDEEGYRIDFYSQDSLVSNKKNCFRRVPYDLELFIEMIENAPNILYDCANELLPFSFELSVNIHSFNPQGVTVKDKSKRLRIIEDHNRKITMNIETESPRTIPLNKAMYYCYDNFRRFRRTFDEA